MAKTNKTIFFLFIFALLVSISSEVFAREMVNYSAVKIRALDKVTARSETADLDINETLAFGSLNITVKACRKSPPIEQPESAAFIEVWEFPIDQMSTEEQPKPVPVFSGWMFASSPGLSSMDHPIYDIWVLDCVGDALESVEESLLDYQAPPDNEDEPELSDEEVEAIENIEADQVEQIERETLFDELQTETLSE